MTHPSPSHEQIALRAYEIWLDRGALHGGDQADWFQAEQELWTDSGNSLASVAREVGAALGTVVSIFHRS
jgi:hypothetical protein